MTKVDRLASCSSLHCQNIVAAGLAKKAEVAQLAYAIGVAQPVSVTVLIPSVLGNVAESKLLKASNL